jgi:hypothetical protein
VLYSDYNGGNSLGLITQQDINIGLYSEDTLRIDGALLAQKGRVGRYYYTSSCSSTYYKQDTITTFGMIATNQRYGFSWVCNEVWCSGYNIRDLQFDSNLTLSPPPLFPTTGEYTFLSWEEILENETY